jgi:hypothetical protein
MKKEVQVKLPDGVLVSDTKYPGLGEEQDYNSMFDLWYTERFGWCIPTLLISSGRKVNMPDRTYATTLDGEPVRIGKGPHVKRTVKVYVRLSRKEALQKFIDLKLAGQETSNDIRDRISTRRLRTSLMRNNFNNIW